MHRGTMPSAPSSITAVVPSKSTLGAIHIYGFYECPKPRNLSARRDACDGGPPARRYHQGRENHTTAGPISIPRRYLIELRRRRGGIRPRSAGLSDGLRERQVDHSLNLVGNLLPRLSVRPLRRERKLRKGDRISSNAASDFTSK